jgi:hypothetical protein
MRECAVGLLDRHLGMAGWRAEHGGYKRAVTFPVNEALAETVKTQQARGNCNSSSVAHLRASMRGCISHNRLSFTFIEQ